MSGWREHATRRLPAFLAAVALAVLPAAAWATSPNDGGYEVRDRGDVLALASVASDATGTRAWLSVTWWDPWFGAGLGLVAEGELTGTRFRSRRIFGGHPFRDLAIEVDFVAGHVTFDDGFFRDTFDFVRAR